MSEEIFDASAQHHLPASAEAPPAAPAAAPEKPRPSRAGKPKPQRNAAAVNFSEALMALKLGMTVTRTGWNGRNMHVALQPPDGLWGVTLPFLYMKTADGETVPWVASHTDLLASDWIVLPQG